MPDSPTLSRAVQAALNYIGLGGAKRKQVTQESVDGVLGNGDLIAGNATLRTSGDVRGVQAGQTMPVLWSRANLAPGVHGVKPAVILAHQKREAPPIFRPGSAVQVIAGAVEELFLAPASASDARLDVWFRNISVRHPLGLVDELPDGNAIGIVWGADQRSFVVQHTATSFSVFRAVAPLPLPAGQSFARWDTGTLIREAALELAASTTALCAIRCQWDVHEDVTAVQQTVTSTSLGYATRTGALTVHVDRTISVTLGQALRAITAPGDATNPVRAAAIRSVVLTTDHHLLVLLAVRLVPTPARSSDTPADTRLTGSLPIWQHFGDPPNVELTIPVSRAVAPFLNQGTTFQVSSADNPVPSTGALDVDDTTHWMLVDITSATLVWSTTGPTPTLIRKDWYATVHDSRYDVDAGTAVPGGSGNEACQSARADESIGTMPLVTRALPALGRHGTETMRSSLFDETRLAPVIPDALTYTAAAHTQSVQVAAHFPEPLLDGSGNSAVLHYSSSATVYGPATPFPAEIYAARASLTYWQFGASPLGPVPTISEYWWDLRDGEPSSSNPFPGQSAGSVVNRWVDTGADAQALFFLTTFSDPLRFEALVVRRMPVGVAPNRPGLEVGLVAGAGRWDGARTYYYVVSAITEHRGASNPLQYEPDERPSPVVSIAVPPSALTTKVVGLLWDALPVVANRAVLYWRVYRSTSSDFTAMGSSLLAVLPAATTTFTDDGSTELLVGTDFDILNRVAALAGRPRVPPLLARLVKKNYGTSVDHFLAGDHGPADFQYFNGYHKRPRPTRPIKNYEVLDCQLLGLAANGDPAFFLGMRRTRTTTSATHPSTTTTEIGAFVLQGRIGESVDAVRMTVLNYVTVEPGTTLGLLEGTLGHLLWFTQTPAQLLASEASIFLTRCTGIGTGAGEIAGLTTLVGTDLTALLGAGLHLLPTDYAYAVSQGQGAFIDAWQAGTGLPTLALAGTPFPSKDPTLSTAGTLKAAATPAEQATTVTSSYQVLPVPAILKGRYVP